LFRTFLIGASAALAGLCMMPHSSSAASMGAASATIKAGPGLTTTAQYWGRPDYWDERPSYRGRRSYDRFDDRDDPPPRYRRQRQREYGERAPRAAPRQGQLPRPGQTGCYVPPPRPHSTPRLVCRY
jgi:hypothetical protein